MLIFFQPTGGILLLLDRKAGEPVELLEIKSRKPAPKPPTGGQSLTTPQQAGAVQILNTEDDDSTEDAPCPDPFEYETDSEEEL